ncbi:MAG TPA: family 43 glycosylhydrolase, partial [Bacteroidales bacterium]|nr:family 43 glycosylhydrolase [Bacteroidales bacterium]
KVRGFDPYVFIDKDGQAYLYWSMGGIFCAKLKENMTEIDSDPVTLTDLPSKGMKEGPFLFERNGIYYLTFPHVADKVTERLEYGMGTSPMGPFKMTGVIMDEHPSGCWTNHHSFINFKGQWYLFYHHNDLSPNFDKNRSARIDSMFFNEDGTIQKVRPTLRGVGLTSAAKQIQLDRYSNISENGTSIAFIDTTNRFGGWKTRLEAKDAWIKYNAVDFSAKKYKTLKVKAASETGGNLELHLDKADGPLVAKITVPKSAAFTEVKAKVTASLKGTQNLVLVQKENKPVEVDWVTFE